MKHQALATIMIAFTLTLIASISISALRRTKQSIFSTTRLSTITSSKPDLTILSVSAVDGKPYSLGVQVKNFGRTTSNGGVVKGK
ncbi:hypothetical protein [Oceanicoccus sp. KOV_DT_Chl]|uniref:hypothetical protein n=1 Tax=Oceanicoccus sp. KOV_DT_Chl TaxID=1904639 RepID=UPI0011AFAC37|nr:hypothetical protein [Oceanicoccus sp. KOV_DT_Chl]